MSRVIDDRVVEMQFDNSDFEKNVSTSLSTLDRLKAALSFKGIEKDFGEVDSATSTLAKSFNALETIATGALLRLGGSVEQWAFNTVKAMSGVENVIAGFGKFGEITKSTGTLKAQGFAMEDIEYELGRLNWFTDETSYNLTDMVGNISKFTAAGQNLTDSADAMMGIALWAALSGQNAQTASRAMYQLSQAMGTGMRRQDWMSIQNANMDTVEFRQRALDAAVAAGTLKESADGMYKSIADGAKYTEWFTRDQFVESLTEGKWFTKDVMMTVFRDYAAAVNDIYAYTEEYGVTASEAIELLGDKVDEFGLKAFKAGQEARTWEDVIDSVKDALSTGWMTGFKLIIGDYEQATKFYTALANEFYDIFVEPINALNEMLKSWNMKGGRSVFIDSLMALLHALINVINLVKEAFHDIFPATTADDLLKATYKFKDFAYAILHATENAEGFKRTLRGVFAIFDIIKQIVSGLIRAIAPLFGGLGSIFGTVLDLTGGLGDMVVSFDKALKEGDFFYKVFSTALKPLIWLKDQILEFVDFIGPKFAALWSILSGKLKEFGKSLEPVKDRIVSFFRNMKDQWIGFFDGINVREKIEQNWGPFTEWVKTTYRQVKEFFSTVIIDKYWKRFRSWIDTTWPAVQDFFNTVIVDKYWKNFSDWVKKTFDQVKKFFSSDVAGESSPFVQGLKNAFEKIKMAISGFVDWAKEHLHGFWDVVTTVFGAVGEFLGKVAEKIIGFFTKDVAGGAKSGFEKFLEIFRTVFGALKQIFAEVWKFIKPIWDTLLGFLSDINLKGVAGALAGGGLFVLGKSLKDMFDSISSSKTLHFFDTLLENLSNVFNSFSHALDAKALKEAATGVAILVASLLVLTFIDQDKLADAVVQMAVVLVAMAGVMKLISKSGWKSNLGAGTAFLEIAAGLLIISLAIAMLSLIKTEKLESVVDALIMLIAVIGLVFALLSKFSNGQKNVTVKTKKKDKNNIGKQILEFAASILIIAVAIKMLGGLETSQLIKGIVGMAAIAAAIIILNKQMSSSDFSAKQGFALIEMALAMVILAKALQMLAKIDDPSKLAIGIFGLGILIMLLGKTAEQTKDSKMLSFGAGVILLSTGLLILVGAIALLGLLDLGKLAQGVLAIGVLLAAFVLVSKFANGNNMLKSAGGITVMAVACALLAGILIALAQLSLGEIGTALLGLGGALGIVVAAGMLANKAIFGLEALGSSLFMIGAAFAAVAAGLWVIDRIDDINKVVDKLADGIIRFFKRLPEIIGAALEGLLRSITRFAATIAAQGWIIISELLEVAVGILEAFTNSDYLGRLLQAGIKILVTLCEGIISAMDGIVAVVVDLITTFVDAIADNLPKIIESAGNLILKFFDSVATWVDDNLKKIEEVADHVITALFRAIIHMLTFGTVDIYELSDEIAEKGIFHALSEKIDEIGWGGLGEKILKGLWEGMKSIWDKVSGWIEGIVEWIEKKFGAASDAILGILGIYHMEKGGIDWTAVAEEAGLDDYLRKNGLKSSKGIGSTSPVGRYVEPDPTVKAAADKIGAWIPDQSSKNSGWLSKAVSAAAPDVIPLTGTTNNNYTMNVNTPKSPSLTELFRLTNQLYNFEATKK